MAFGYTPRRKEDWAYHGRGEDVQMEYHGQLVRDECRGYIFRLEVMDPHTGDVVNGSLRMSSQDLLEGTVLPRMMHAMERSMAEKIKQVALSKGLKIEVGPCSK